MEKSENKGETIEELKLRLEKEGMEKIAALKQANALSGEAAIEIIKDGEKEFVKKNGRYMTYAEMRSMYG
jgi:hypothetical protein